MSEWKPIADEIYRVFERIDVLFRDVQNGDAAEDLLIEAREHLACAFSDVRTAHTMVERARQGRRDADAE